MKPIRLAACAAALAAVSAYFVIVSLLSREFVYDAPGHGWYRLFPIAWGRPPHARPYEDPLAVNVTWAAIAGSMFAVTFASAVQTAYTWHRRATRPSPAPVASV